MNPWLITWETHREKMRNPIAAILHNSTSIEKVRDVMRLLYANYLASAHNRLYPFEQVQFARRRYQCNPRLAQFLRIFTDDSPLMFARHVYDMRQTKDANGYQILTWEEGIFDLEVKQETTAAEINALFNRKKRRPRKRQQMTFFAQTGVIKMGAELVDEVPCQP